MNEKPETQWGPIAGCLLPLKKGGKTSFKVICGKATKVCFIFDKFFFYEIMKTRRNSKYFPQEFLIKICLNNHTFNFKIVLTFHAPYLHCSPGDLIISKMHVKHVLKRLHFWVCILNLIFFFSYMYIISYYFEKYIYLAARRTRA